MKKKILLLALKDYDLYKSIEKNLIEVGYEVTLVLNGDYKFKYKSIWQRLNNFKEKLFFKRKKYKLKLKSDFDKKEQLRIINSNSSYDYCLVIRADFFNIDILKQAKSNSGLFIAYHYDGLGRDIRIFDRINFFDRFYVFDKNDIIKYPQYKLQLENNFYFDCYQNKLIQKTNNHREVYFLGSYHASRMDDLIYLQDLLLKANLSVSFELLCNFEILTQLDVSLYKNTRFLTEIVPYELYLDRMLSSDIILDVLISEHVGFSFRIFEGLYYKKKVITTNAHVLDMDFYHENNYFVFDGNNIDGLIDFINRPYKSMDPEIVNKYSFTKWIERIVNTEELFLN